MRYAPTAPSRTKTTLVGQVQGSPAPTPNTQGPLFIKNKNQVSKKSLKLMYFWKGFVREDYFYFKLFFLHIMHIYKKF